MLTLINLLFVGHFIQWWIMGYTLSPLEPSESMQTLEVGLINAGFILFGLAIVSTLIFGRYFCGWGCHIVALQDLCGAILKRLGIRPKPFRSRLLVYVPLLTAFYMFLWPQVLRISAGEPFPTLKAHLMTDDLWATFPGPTVAILTFAVCGFLIVYLLGNKGFCTYGCPYGGIFYYADKIAPGKIRVTDACDQCGHCTATCSSNVKVSQEVLLYKMVVDAGCLKCMDCVDVCPKNALYFGFGTPAVSKGKPKAVRDPRPFDFSWPEEIAMALIFIGSFYALRGLYDAVPLLLAVGGASISAYLLILGARIAYQPAVRLQRSQLKTPKGLTFAGVVYLVFCLLLLGFTVQSGLIQYHSHEADRYLARAQALFDQGRGGGDEASSDAEAAFLHLNWADRNGLFEVARWKGKLGSIESFRGRYDSAEQYLKRSIELDPYQPNMLFSLATVLEVEGKDEDALSIWRKLYALRASPENGLALGARLVAANRFDEAEKVLKKASEGLPKDISVWKALGKAQAALNDQPGAMMSLGHALQINDRDAEAHYLFGLTLGARNQDQALKEFQLSAQLDPKYLPPRLLIGKIDLGTGRFSEAAAALEEARLLAPEEPELIALWADAQVKSGRARETLSKLIRASTEDDASWYAAAILYGRLGEKVESRAILERLKRRNPSNSQQ